MINGYMTSFGVPTNGNAFVIEVNGDGGVDDVITCYREAGAIGGAFKC